MECHRDSLMTVTVIFIQTDKPLVLRFYIMFMLLLLSPGSRSNVLDSVEDIQCQNYLATIPAADT